MLSSWGATYAAAREAERAAASKSGPDANQWRARAAALREHANRLHAEILSEKPSRDAGAAEKAR